VRTRPLERACRRADRRGPAVSARQSAVACTAAGLHRRQYAQGACLSRSARRAHGRGGAGAPARSTDLNLIPQKGPTGAMVVAANARPAHPRAVATRWSIAAAKAPRADKVAFRGHTWLRTVDRPILGRLLPDGRSHREDSRSRRSALPGVM